jgi:hypothetical protein
MQDCEERKSLRSDWRYVAIPVPTGFGEKQVLSEIATAS